jgi:hypothetical protein
MTADALSVLTLSCPSARAADDRGPYRLSSDRVAIANSHMIWNLRSGPKILFIESSTSISIRRRITSFKNKIVGVADFDGIKATIPCIPLGVAKRGNGGTMHARRHSREYEYGPWRHPFGILGCCFGWPPPRRPSRREETQALKDYIADLKEELEDAEERFKEVEKPPER